MTNDNDKKGPTPRHPEFTNSERQTVALESQATDDLKKLTATTVTAEPERINLVPRYKTDFQPRSERTPNRLVYFGDYHKLLLKMGMARFRAAFPFPFLAGIGTVGILNANHSNLADKTSEVYIGDLNEEPTSNPSLGGRVWLLRPAEDRRGANHFTLGRSMLNDVVIPEFAISRKHCSFSLTDKKLYMKDMGSRNGTIVGSTLLDSDEEHQLQNLDILILGRFTFQIFTPGGMIQALYDWEAR